MTGFEYMKMQTDKLHLKLISAPWMKGIDLFGAWVPYQPCENFDEFLNGLN